MARSQREVASSSLASSTKITRSGAPAASRADTSKNSRPHDLLFNADVVQCRCGARRPGRAVRVVPARGRDHFVEGIHLLSLQALGDRSAVPALSCSRHLLHRLSAMSVANISASTSPTTMRASARSSRTTRRCSTSPRRAIPHGTRTIVDLGVGTGALSARCLAVRAARARGRHRPRSRRSSRWPRGGFAAAPRSPPVRSFATALPRCDAAVASFSLHHVRTRAAKGRALPAHPRGAAARRPFPQRRLPAGERSGRSAARSATAWLAHLRRAYTAARCRPLLEAWAGEDVYVPLDAELELMRRSGFRVEVLWRRGAFAVLRAAR